jgi:hypothetical protein
MLFHMGALGDDEADDIPHFEEDEELGSVRDETLDEEAEDELIGEEHPTEGALAPPPPASKKPTRKKSKSKKPARKARPKKNTKRSKPRGRRGGKKSKKRRR